MRHTDEKPGVGCAPRTREDGLVVPDSERHDVSHELVSFRRPPVEEVHTTVGALRGHERGVFPHHLARGHLHVREEKLVQPPRFLWGRGRRHRERARESVNWEPWRI